MSGAGWHKAVEAAAGGAFGRVLLLGPADSCKSAFCRPVLARAARRGHGAAFIDADPGQKIVGRGRGDGGAGRGAG